tara:strand:- start:1770 stop:1949 length:180 start_codon:yes stop_codon:yes gene_type:complete
MTKFGKVLLSLYGLLVAGMILSVSCVKHKEPETTPRSYDFSELEDEDLDDLPEDTAEDK